MPAPPGVAGFSPSPSVFGGQPPSRLSSAVPSSDSLAFNSSTSLVDPLGTSVPDPDSKLPLLMDERRRRHSCEVQSRSGLPHRKLVKRHPRSRPPEASISRTVATQHFEENNTPRKQSNRSQRVLLSAPPDVAETSERRCPDVSHTMTQRGAIFSVPIFSIPLDPEPLPLPAGAQPAQPSSTSWLLARNPSTSTQATIISSETPSTVDSTCLITPREGETDTSDWHQPVSRSSSLFACDKPIDEPCESGGAEMSGLLRALRDENVALTSGSQSSSTSTVRPAFPALATSSNKLKSNSTVHVASTRPNVHTSPVDDCERQKTSTLEHRRRKSVSFDPTIAPSSSTPSLIDNDQLIITTRGKRSHVKSDVPGHVRTISTSAKSHHTSSMYSVVSVGDIEVTGMASRTAATTVRFATLGDLELRSPGPKASIDDEPLRSRPTEHQVYEGISKRSPMSRSRSVTDKTSRSSSHLHLFEPPSRSTTNLPSPLVMTISPADGDEESDTVILSGLALRIAERPAIPERRSSLTQRLWRRLSGRKRPKTGTASEFRLGSAADAPRAPPVPPPAAALLDALNATPLFPLPSPRSSLSRGWLEETISEVPLPSPRSSSLGVARGRRLSSHSTPPMTTHFISGMLVPSRRSSLPRAGGPMEGDGIANPGVYSTSIGALLSGQAVMASPDLLETVRAGISADIPDCALDADVGLQCKKKEYRQTLVDIQDDKIFHQVLADLARLENAERAGESKSLVPEGSARLLSDTCGQHSTAAPAYGQGRLLSCRGDRGSNKRVSGNQYEDVQAWFVTRELVQGERRYGRLLASGVTVSSCSFDLELPFLSCCDCHLWLLPLPLPI